MSNLEITVTINTTRQIESFMRKDKKKGHKREQQISAIEPTNDQLTGRAGLSVFAPEFAN
jgi:hypothetical protein